MRFVMSERSGMGAHDMEQESFYFSLMMLMLPSNAGLCLQRNFKLLCYPLTSTRGSQVRLHSSSCGLVAQEACGRVPAGSSQVY